MSTLPHVITTQHDGIPVVAPVGDFDIATVTKLRSRFFAVDAMHSHIIVDLSGTTFVDSTILGVFVGVRRRVAQTGGWLRVVDPQPNVRRLFQVTGLDSLFDIFPAVEDAAAGAAAGAEPSRGGIAQLENA